MVEVNQYKDKMSNLTDLEVVTALLAVDRTLSADRINTEVNRARCFVDALAGLGYTVTKTVSTQIAEAAETPRATKRAKRTRVRHAASPKSDADKLYALLAAGPRSAYDLRQILNRGSKAIDVMVDALRARGTVVVEARTPSNRGKYKYKRVFSLGAGFGGSNAVRVTPLKRATKTH